MPTETHTEKNLTVDLNNGEGEVVLSWKGKSHDREPGRFLMPLLTRALQLSNGANKRLRLDFTALDYMKSSTVSALVKFLDEAAKSPCAVVIEYAKNRKWQELSFSALKAFETSDGRITIRAR